VRTIARVPWLRRNKEINARRSVMLDGDIPFKCAVNAQEEHPRRMCQMISASRVVAINSITQQTQLNATVIKLPIISTMTS
jgi:hypothetical protein